MALAWNRRWEWPMDYQFLDCEDFLIIKLSGTATVNERLLVREHLAPHLGQSRRKVIVDLQGVTGKGKIYIVGVMNVIQKEFKLLGCEVKFCLSKPGLCRYFEENRLDAIFDISHSIEQIKSKFKEKNNED